MEEMGSFFEEPGLLSPYLHIVSPFFMLGNGVMQFNYRKWNHILYRIWVPSLQMDCVRHGTPAVYKARYCRASMCASIDKRGTSITARSNAPRLLKRQRKGERVRGKLS